MTVAMAATDLDSRLAGVARQYDDVQAELALPETSRDPDALRRLGLRVEGLMTIPPAGDDPHRWCAALRELGGDLGVHHLSMGMTDDYEIAVEEGATMVRIGRGIFGPRRSSGPR